MAVQKYPALGLEYKYFDLLRNPIEIAVYAIIQRYHPYETTLDAEDIDVYCERIGITREQRNAAIDRLIEIKYSTKGN